MSVVIAILAKEKAHVLPFYLKCILSQTFPKHMTHLYIRTNDNNDATEQILSDFIKEHGDNYASVFFDASSIKDFLKNIKPHDWTCERFKILGKIRQDSIQYAIKKKAAYFVVDCDNFIAPFTLERLLALQLDVVAPLLESATSYSNYHYEVDANGYYAGHEMYLKILNRSVKGCIEVKVVHCTYLIHNRCLSSISYNDESHRYEYVIFSDVLRKKGIPQYMDNRYKYGFLTFADTDEDFNKEMIKFKNYLPLE